MMELSDNNDNYINFMETKSKSKIKSKTKSKSTSTSTSLTEIKINLKNRATLQLTSSFKEHAKVVERINELNLGWKAFNYEKFSDLTIAQLNKLSGRNKNYGQSEFYNDISSYKHRYRKPHKKPKLSKNYPTSEADSNYKDLPKNFFKWKRFVSHARSQVIFFLTLGKLRVLFCNINCGNVAI